MLDYTASVKGFRRLVSDLLGLGVNDPSHWSKLTTTPQLKVKNPGFWQFGGPYKVANVMMGIVVHEQYFSNRSSRNLRCLV